MRRRTKLFLGFAVAACLLGLVEVGARIFWGDPPISRALSRITSCELQEDQGQSWIECRWLHGKVDRWAVLDNPAEKTRPRVVVLGGSSVYHANDNNPHVNFPRVMQRLLPDVEVINLGTPGIDSAGVLWMSEQAKALQPDLLVIYTGHNDFSEMVFKGGIRGTRLWLVPILQFFDRSWIYSLLAQPKRGNKLPGRMSDGIKNPDHPRICPKEESMLFVGGASRARKDRQQNWLAGINRQTVLPIEDTAALKARDEVLGRLEANLRSIVDNADAPVMLVTLMRNFDHHPSGVLVAHRKRCRRALGCLSAVGLYVPEAVLSYSEAACGESSMTYWLESLVARRDGNIPAAVEAFNQSLALDPLPLRAPGAADDVIRRVAQDSDAYLVDMTKELGPVFPGEWFSDNLHFSITGTLKVAGVLAPAVESALQKGSAL
jgi:lysophospholipase L1-like esterase